MQQSEFIENKMLSFAINNAELLFKEMEGEFYPFGLVCDNDGQIIRYYNEV